jgi:predicted Zn-dependent protease with MMP-like domain
MQAEVREMFDQQLEVVLAELPDQVHQLLDQVPLVVEDYPSRAIRERLGVHGRDQLCGLYTGIPLNRRQVGQGGVLSDVIHLFREGVLSLAARGGGTLDPWRLQREIRVTILHELGHHHGLNEADLQALGY